MLKRCSCCKENLDFDQFGNNRANRDGLQSECKSCRSQKDYGSFPARVIKGCRTRAAKLNLEFDLDIVFLNNLNTQQAGLCAVSGVPLNWNKVSRCKGQQRVCPHDRVSVDRIDYRKGYTRSNVRLVTETINRMRGRLSDDELLEVCRQLISFHDSKQNK